MELRKSAEPSETYIGVGSWPNGNPHFDSNGHRPRLQNYAKICTNMGQMKPGAILEKMRPICLSLENTDERETWGHPTFIVAGRPFAVFEQYKGEWCLCFRVEMEHRDLFLKDNRFFVTPYIGKHGWLSLRVHAARINWREIRHLITESHRLAAAGGKRRQAKVGS